ncbi:translational GTPase TypA [Candidatus Viridilinea mediisalina]|uniref:Large ribosomal subunit assembly factor BipA n=1 Tax=Candidatus Viridilinea mediisalina TaxID=2024553 RepID=A0A2A6RHY5_9CHLR|nr:translational GTPase TypA [Candidatus Viridilinea mediisalina]PDW02561.1 translational GTPase TypA [Candidatus Viridilinea mediisalina]
MRRNDIRNIAIIAHVDHGKTTLVDALLKQSRIFRENQAVEARVMDSNALERERGITILSKTTAVSYKDFKINIVDTPGHADFGGEVERVMNMVDGVLLLVDAADGPMPQTKFVLRKALQAGHQAIVVVNKVDRPQARPNWVVNATFDLFVDLGASDEQAEFATIYTNALTGHAGRSPLKMHDSLEPLFEAIIDRIPAPDVDATAPAQFLVTTSAYDDYKGKIVTGRLYRGTISKGQALVRIDREGNQSPAKLSQLFVYNGLQRQEVESAQAGDLIALAGIGDANIGDTITDALQPEALPTIKVEEPTVRMTFGVNTSPFAGKEGQFVTSRKLRERLYQETERDVALRVTDTDSADVFLVAGRGELHLGILIETMRREGYEFQVSKPEVIFQQGADGTRLEPMELVEIEVANDYQGVVVELLGRRQGEMRDMHVRDDGTVHYVYLVPTRGLLGFRQLFLTATRGTGILNSLFYGYEPIAGDMEMRENGSLIASEGGTVSTYGINQVQDRGTFFVTPGQDVYEGMVVGQHIRDVDLEVNVCKEKHLTNIRNNKGAEVIRLDAARSLSLDDAIEYIGDDELVEVTPKGWRIRKKLLSSDDRRREKKRRDLALA